MLQFPIHTEYRLTSKYGRRIHPITGVWSGHNGIDLAVPLNTPLHAPDKGTITSSFTNAVGGNQVIITHPGNVKTGYAHLNSRPPKGTKVRRGEIFAYSGNTGRSTGPHLHLTVKKRGELVDPESIAWQKGQKVSVGTVLAASGIGILAYSAIYLLKKD